jgi:thymidylate synthase (FAD)
MMKCELIDHMGTDLTVVNAARVSFDNESEWEYGCNADCREHGHSPSEDCPVCEKIGLNSRDIKLIKYLAKHNHWTPFSHVMITMRETVPIFVARQRFKHMVGFTYNEVSRRYVDDEPEFYVPDVWRGRPVNAKQGSSDVEITTITWKDAYGEGLNETTTVKEEYECLLQQVKIIYDKFIEAGVAPEQARMVLPQSAFTSYYTTGSLAAWARAYKLRSKPEAQAEIRELARKWDYIINSIDDLTHSWTALTTTEN